MCVVCDHPQREEIENDIKNDKPRIAKKYGIRDYQVSKHRLHCMKLKAKYNIKKKEQDRLDLIITKAEFCELCLEKEECKHKGKLRNCEYWREYSEDMGRSA
jgi:hypothetical protein